jgi:Leucine-rich repeat (LRR) protein
MKTFRSKFTDFFEISCLLRWNFGLPKLSCRDERDPEVESVSIIFSFLSFFRFILTSFVCLMTGDAFGRHLECSTQTYYFTLWPSFKYCATYQVDYSASFEKEKHSFSIKYSQYYGSAQKSEIKTFYIRYSAQVDFIPLDILSEFPNLNGLMLEGCDLPIVKSGLFKEELQKIEYLDLAVNKIESIEPEAFEFLIKLKWIRLSSNNLQSLPYRLFENNPDLFYINFNYDNKINSIHPSAFDGLQKLKLIDFTNNKGCINVEIGCETCLISQSEIRGNLQGCFDNCSNGTTCYSSHLAHEASQTTEISQTTTENPIESNSTEKKVEGIEELIDQKLGEVYQNFTQMAVKAFNERLSDLKNSVENMPKVIEKAIETNNQNMQECCAANKKAVEKLQEAVENQLKELQPVNLQPNESAQLFAAQQENMELKMELLELKCAKKEDLMSSENKALREEIQNLKAVEKLQEAMETQLKGLEEKLALMVQEKLDDLKDKLENNGG